MPRIDEVGADWLAGKAKSLTERIERMTPVEFNEANRFLPASVTSIEGYIRFDVNPYMREIVNCFDVDSPVREVNLKKGVQITYTTCLESVALYFMAHVKTLPMMYLTIDNELAELRIENNFLPMLHLSDLAHIIRSSDEGNTRKTGKTKRMIQHEGGGYLVPGGIQTPKNARQTSICVMLKDEIDGWPDTVGADGDPDALTDDRCSGYWPRRKIFRGSTPLIEGSSKIEAAYLRGDQRKYRVICMNPECREPNELVWRTENKDTGVVGGFKWDLDGRQLVKDSVRYCCPHCGHAHYEADKEALFSEECGAHWKPTAVPVDPEIRSYHLPAMYSPIGMQPWSKCVDAFLQAYDPTTKKTLSIGKYQRFRNNVLAETFEIRGDRIVFQAVSGHRRSCYALGTIPNVWASEYAGSPVAFLTCQVDVHKRFLAVAVMGWTVDAKCFLIEYKSLETENEDEDCREISHRCWGHLQSLLEEKRYVADDGREYGITITLIDAGDANDTVVAFCATWDAGGVYPILGRDRPEKNQKVEEFAEWTTRAGTIGYKIMVDHYKDRLAPVLRREWHEDYGPQDPYHFNAPVDLPDSALLELTKESRRSKTDPKGIVTHYWYRPSGAANELWDLLVYGHAAVEILAWSVCINDFELETVNWPRFWEVALKNPHYSIDTTVNKD